MLSLVAIAADFSDSNASSPLPSVEEAVSVLDELLNFFLSCFQNLTYSSYSCILTQNLVVSSCTGTQRNETLTNCVTTPCMDMKTIGIPPCTGTPGQPPKFASRARRLKTHVHLRRQLDPVSRFVNYAIQLNMKFMFLNYYIW